MIKKLRRRFITINMSLVTVVLLGIFFANSLSTAQQISSNSYSYLNDSKRQIQLIPHDENIPKKGTPPKAFPQDIIWLESSSSGIEILNQDNAPDYNEEYINEIMEIAINDDNAQGLLREYNLRYIKVIRPEDRNTVGFIDVSYEQKFIYNQITNYLLIGLASLAVFFVISFILSNIAIKPVEKSFKHQQQFISDASHELKTPITVIMANASIMKNENPSQNSKWLDYIEKEAKRMKKLVDDLLFLTRLDEADKIQLHTKFNLSDTLYSCILPFESVAFENGLSLDNEIEDELYINGNIEQIKRLILILIDNACKYGTQNTAITTTLKSSGSKVKLSINNIGKAIPTEDIDKIFDRFYRVDKARERNSNSYGLGLSMAKKIVDSHHGEIKVFSNETNGTTFTVSLNLANK